MIERGVTVGFRKSESADDLAESRPGRNKASRRALSQAAGLSH